MENVSVKIKKTGRLGWIGACNLPLIDDCNYCVCFDNSENIKKWYYGNELELSNEMYSKLESQFRNQSKEEAVYTITDMEEAFKYGQHKVFSSKPSFLEFKDFIVTYKSKP